MSEITCPIATSAEQHGEQPAIIQSDGYITYIELSHLVHQTVQWITSRKWQRGERIALLLHPSVEYYIALAALFRADLVACPLSTRIPATTIRHQLAQLGCRAVITDRDYLMSGLTDIEVCTLSDLSVEDAAETEIIPSIELTQPATILFTSGSSGDPKAALHKYANHYSNALGSNQNIPVNPGDRWLLSLPLFHVGGIGILFRAWLGGGAVAIPERTESLAESIGKYGITHLSLVATQLYRLLFDETNVDFRPLKHILLGGSAIPNKLIETAILRRLPIHTSYGLTEMGSQVTATAVDDNPARLYTSGKTLNYRELHITRESEILVRGMTLFDGYIQGDTINPSIDSDGWFHTGDIGYLDSAGYLHVTGRKDNMFISGGENIHPEEIEEALANLPEIAQAVVVPVQHPGYGFRPVAFVRMIDPHPLRSSYIRERLNQTLPRFKLPDRIYPWPEEMLTGMKPDRGYFRNLARTLSDFND